jgi:hypothetical protein
MTVNIDNCDSNNTANDGYKVIGRCPNSQGVNLANGLCVDCSTISSRRDQFSTYCFTTCPSSPYQSYISQDNSTCVMSCPNKVDFINKACVGSCGSRFLKPSTNECYCDQTSNHKYYNQHDNTCHSNCSTSLGKLMSDSSVDY